MGTIHHNTPAPINITMMMMKMMLVKVMMVIVYLPNGQLHVHPLVLLT